MKKLVISDLGMIDEVASNFINHYRKNKIITFKGSMGAGKTTFIKAICKSLGVGDTVNSPSFAIVNEYQTINEEPIFHFDFYRLKSIDEAYDMGYEDYFYSGAYCFIEWPEKIESLLPDKRLDLHFEEVDNNSRVVHIYEI